MTPQPEESPDEILARRIERLRAHIQEDEYYQFFEAAQEKKNDLAMLEAMRAARPVMKAMAEIADWYGDMFGDDHEIQQYMAGEDGHECSFTLGQCRQAKEALRQSDDAIRGMRG